MVAPISQKNTQNSANFQSKEIQSNNIAEVAAKNIPNLSQDSKEFNAKVSQAKADLQLDLDAMQDDDDGPPDERSAPVLVKKDELGALDIIDIKNLKDLAAAKEQVASKKGFIARVSPQKQTLNFPVFAKGSEQEKLLESYKDSAQKNGLSYQGISLKVGKDVAEDKLHAFARSFIMFNMLRRAPPVRHEEAEKLVKAHDARAALHQHQGAQQAAPVPVQDPQAANVQDALLMDQQQLAKQKTLDKKHAEAELEREAERNEEKRTTRHLNEKDAKIKETQRHEVDKKVQHETVAQNQIKDEQEHFDVEKTVNSFQKGTEEKVDTLVSDGDTNHPKKVKSSRNKYSTPQPKSTDANNPVKPVDDKSKT